MDFSFNLNDTYTFWSGLLGGLFLMLAYFGCDQSQVQRYLTARSIDEGRTSLLMSAVFKIPIQFVILLIGVLVFLFYQFTTPPMLFNPAVEQELQGNREYALLSQEYQTASSDLRRKALAALNAPDERQAYEQALARREQIRSEAQDLAAKANGPGIYNDVNFVFPTFVTTQLPIGIVGLIVAAIFAAAMSSISAELNSLATTSVIDVYRRLLRREAPDRHYLLVSKLATAFWGLMACIVAVYATQLGSLIEVVNRFGSFFYGSLLGVFVLAIGTRWATPWSAFLGLLGGMAAVGVVSISTNVSFLWYNVVGVVAVVAVAAVVSSFEKLLRTKPKVQRPNSQS
ncbi:MAG: hypothetical protein P8Y94_01245 [Acidobacteriota bacterium]